MGYQPGWSWDDLSDDLTRGTVGLFLAGGILLAAVVATLLIVLATEIARVHQHVWPTTQRPLVLGADAALGIVALIGALLAATPGAEALAAYLGAWALFFYVIVIEFAAYRVETIAADPGLLESYLDPFAAPEPSRNGQTSIPAGMR